ncbi:MAG: NapC/NirT family cytochrome c [Candidatus Sulfotelmatobacter sp.]
MESEPGKTPEGQPKRGFWGVIQWIFLWGTIFGLTGVALVATTNKAVIWSSSDAFCGTFCHTMTWSSAAYHQGPHFINASGVRASCGQCHIPYDSSHATATEYVKLLLYKADRGAKDFWNELRKTIATKEEWEKQRPQLRTQFENYTRAHNYITLKAAGGKLYQAQCASCHGAKLEGGAGPSLKGATWHLIYGGAKLLTIWGEITGPMAQYAGTTYTTQQSLDIVSYLLQQNGLPSGNQPLAGARQSDSRRWTRGSISTSTRPTSSITRSKDILSLAQTLPLGKDAPPIRAPPKGA